MAQPLLRNYVVLSSAWAGLILALLAGQAGTGSASWSLLITACAGLAGLIVTAALCLHRALQQATPAQQQLLQAVADNLPEAVFVKDPEGRYLLFNREAARLAGVPAEQVLGRSDHDIYNAEQAAVLRANDLRVLELRQPLTLEEELDTADGRLTFSATKGVLRDASGRTMGLFGISRDVTKELQAQRQLLDSERHYRLLFLAHPLPMWVFNLASLRFLAVNPAALAHYGYSEAEFLSMTIADIRPADEAGRLAAVLSHKQHKPGHDLRQAGPWRHCCKDGRVIDVEISTNDLQFRGEAARLVLAQDVTQRRVLLQQREEAHAMLMDVLARVDDGFVALDRDWRYTYVNPQAARMLGRTHPQELLGKHIWTEYPEGVGQPFHKAYEQAMASQEPAVFEEHYLPWNRWFENRLYPSENGLSIYFTNITDRKRAEQALRHSENRYRLAASNGQVWDWDLRTGRTTMPVQFWQQLGQDPPLEADTVTTFTSLLHPDDVPVWRAALRAHVQHRRPYDLEFRARHADGSWRWFQTSGQAVWQTDGRATFMAGTTFDISERKRAQTALQEALAYQRSLIEQLADGVLLVDDQLTVLDSNPQMLHLLRMTTEQLLQRPVGDVVLPEERHRVAEVVHSVLQGQPHLATWELVRADGSRFMAEASARRLDAHRLVAVVRDVTARRAAEQAVHDYRNQLSALAQRLLTQEKETTRRVAQALHDQLGQTLAVARLKVDTCIARYGPGMPEELQRLSGRVAALLAQAVQEVRQVLADLRPPLLEEQGLSAALENEWGPHTRTVADTDVLLELDDGVEHLRWPPDVEYGCFMVAREAIANALQHAQASLIRVLLAGDATYLHLAVIDDGKGIPKHLVHGRPGRLGLVGMRERAAAIHARLSVSQLAAGGTRVTLHWPAEHNGPTPRA